MKVGERRPAVFLNKTPIQRNVKINHFALINLCEQYGKIGIYIKSSGKLEFTLKVWKLSSKKKRVIWRN